MHISHVELRLHLTQLQVTFARLGPAPVPRVYVQWAITVHRDLRPLLLVHWGNIRTKQVNKAVTYARWVITV